MPLWGCLSHPLPSRFSLHGPVFEGLLSDSPDRSCTSSSDPTTSIGWQRFKRLASRHLTAGEALALAGSHFPCAKGVCEGLALNIQQLGFFLATNLDIISCV